MMNETHRSHRQLAWLLYLISLLAAGCVLLLGVVVIFGWHAGSRALIQIVPTFAPMQYNTALGFVFCGAGLLLLAARRRGWAATAGLLAAALGGLTLVEYAGHVDLGIDQLFMKHDVTVQTSHPGRMAPNTAICFVLAGLSLGLQRTRWPALYRSLVSVLLASLLFGLAVVALGGYFTRLETAYGWGNLTRMALHTSIGFVVLGTGILCRIWSGDAGDESWLPRWLPIPAALGILTATLCCWQALVAEGVRIQRQYQDLSQVSNLATLTLVVGILLALAMALAAYMAQRAYHRARQLDRANFQLWEEIETRKAAEQALQAHRDNLENVVAERTSELERARQDAESANRAKSDFLSHMSHELRTPLNGILGYAQILQRSRDTTPKQRDHLASIINCGDHLLSLINDVLDLSKIEAGRLEVDRGPVELAKLLQEVADVVAERATSKGISLDVDTAPDVPPRIVTDGAKLRQMLINLAGNAVKFTQEGEVRLVVSESPRGCLRFEVTDTGIGMDPDELKEVFDPFKQVEAGKAAGGTGLGLAITKRLAEALDARLDVQSEKGQGSTFTITLPLVESPIEEWSGVDLPGGMAGAHLVLAPGQDFTILVADDRETNRNVLEGMLAAAGFHTRIATDGDEALETLRTYDDIDLVLMDVRMPRVSGLEALSQIRADESLCRLKVIAVTASVFPEFKQKAIAAGFDDFLGKPFRVEELTAKLQDHLAAEFVADTAPAGAPAATQTVVSDPRAGMTAPPAIADRLRKALKIKNVTAIRAVADELCQVPATELLGRRVTELARAFDFTGLNQLVDQMEQVDGSR